MLHQDLTKEKWQALSIFEQMANVGAEVGRAINWRKKDENKSQSALQRGVELLDLTIEDKKNRDKLKELCLLKEVLVDYFYSNKMFVFSDKQWEDYFYPFNYAAAVQLHLTFK